jgi:hypothetical protein
MTFVVLGPPIYLLLFWTMLPHGYLGVGGRIDTDAVPISSKHSDTTLKETHASILDEHQELGSKLLDMSTMTHGPPIHGVSETFRYEPKKGGFISQG